MKNKTKVLVAMSGGVDSSVAALLMKKQDYEVIGAFMKNWSDTKNDLGECTWKDDRREALKVASKLGIPIVTLDFEKEYRRDVVNEMFKLYKQGITPNPDIDCNNKVKFPLLWKAAKRLKADFMVTGHYARIKKIVDNKKNSQNNKIKLRTKNSVNNKLKKAGRGSGGLKNYKYELHRAKDETKDQSYFLYRLNESDLSHTIFPIGNYTKKQVRKIAQDNDFPNFARKSTVGICFIGKVNLKDFLKKKIEPKKGRVLNSEGKQIGQHDGIFYYTIGQRLGPRFGIDIEKGGGKQKRWYVARKNLKKNEIIAAPEGHEMLYRKEIILSQCHWINKAPRKTKKTKVHARIRQVGELLPATLSNNKGKYKIILKKAITGVSEGQACVLYEIRSKKVLGGGVIGFD